MRNPILAIAGCLLLAGCACQHRASNRSIVRDTLARFPDGGGVYVEIEQEESPRGQVRVREETLFWEQPNRARKTLIASRRAIPANDYTLTKTELSDDGDRATVLKDGRTIATFDYAAGTATFAP
jgi:hypothetical protein